MATPLELNQLYLAYFGRPPDAAGLAFYAGMPAAEVARQFSVSPESEMLYGIRFDAGMVSRIYQNLFNRPAEADGIAYWTAQVASGTLTAAGAALAILQGGQNDDRRAVDNKLAVIERWVAANDTPAEQAAYSGSAAAAAARALLASVDGSAGSLAAAQGKVADTLAKLLPPAPSGGGESVPTAVAFTLTTLTDTFTGAATDDSFTGTLRTGGTFGAADVLDGGLGTDTLDLGVEGNQTLNTSNVSNVETLVLRSIGATANEVQLSAAAASSLRTLTLSGSQALSLKFSDNNIRGSLTTIDASQLGAGLTLGSMDANGSLGAAAQTVMLGSGDDTVYFGANLTGADKVDGGGGFDVLAVTAALTNADLAQVSHVEAIRFTAAVTQDAGITSLAGLRLQAVATGDVAFAGLASGRSIDVVGSLTKLTAQLADGSGGADTLTVRLGGSANTTLGTLDATAGLETLNLESVGAAGTVNTLSADLSTSAQVVTGTNKLVIGGRLATASFDASAMTGAVELSSHASLASTIKTGSGNDTVKLGTGADTVNTGAGNDVIWTTTRVFDSPNPVNAATGGDLITTGSGNDVVVFSGNFAIGASTATSYGAFTTVLDFEMGADLLGFSAANEAFAVRRNGSSSDTPGLSKQGSSAFGSLSAGDAMVVQSVAKNGGAVAAIASASFFKLTTAVSFTTNVQTTFADALGSTVVVGLAQYCNFLVSLYDTTNQKMVIGIVNTGWPNDGDNRIEASDLPGVAIIGTVSMTQAEYVSFGAANLAAAY